MDIRRMRLDGPCPGCGRPTLDYTAMRLDMPYFQDVTQLLFGCDECGFRHGDFLVGSSRSPVRHTYAVRNADDVDIRVVRSTSGTIRMPELGVLIEPGPASDAYVSNIEGVLVRVEGIVNQLVRDAESDEVRTEGRKRLADLRAARAGKFAFTFILEDPYGNSAIVHDKTRTEPLTPDEAVHLKTGELTLDLQELVPKGEGTNGRRGNGA